MDGKDDMDIGPDGSSRISRACDSCRNRKIRCDRQIPCSNCKASKLHCQTTAPTQKVQRQRVHISDEYEKKIDRIEDRLSGIEQVLEALSAKLSALELPKSHSAEQGSQSAKSTGKTGRSPHSSIEVSSGTPAPFEGDTALHVQSEVARELLLQAVGNTPSMRHNTEVQATLASLKELVSKQNQSTSTSNEPQPFLNKALADIDAAKLERPPWDAVDEVIKKSSIYPTMCFAVIFPFLKMNDLNPIFKEAYGNPDGMSPGRRIIVYGALYNLFMEFAGYPLLGPKVKTYKAYAALCRIHLETAMSQLDLFLPASYENILALLLAASYAIELCKPSFCWTLTSTAAGLCQTLGYHRRSSMKDDTDEERSAKLHVFWFVYLLDKTLSLRLGRASAIQDWDMDVPYLIADPTDPTGLPKGTEMQVYWIKVAQIQGQTYERLFAPAAFSKSEEERNQIAVELSSALNQAWSIRGHTSVLDMTYMGSSLRDQMPEKNPNASSNTSDLPSRMKRAPFYLPTESQVAPDDSSTSIQDIEDTFGHVSDLFYHADIVTHYSTITLIQRAMAREHGMICSQDCLDSARAALVAHKRCSQQFNVKGSEDLWSGYVHWSILQAPFTPFIVIFCNAISTCSRPDLASLSEFVLSLESCRTVSEGAEKLYKLCYLFMSVAKLYIEAKSKEAASQIHATPSSMARAHSTEAFYVTPDGQQGDFGGVNQFDPFLSALGLVPGQGGWQMPITTGFPPMQTADGIAQGPLDANSGNQNNVQNWFSGSRYIMGLMEDDINMPDLNLQ